VDEVRSGLGIASQTDAGSTDCVTRLFEQQMEPPVQQSTRHEFLRRWRPLTDLLRCRSRGKSGLLAVGLHALRIASALIAHWLRQLMAQSCRLRQRHKLGSFLGYTDRGGNLLGGPAPDPLRTFGESC
jgi:hypothetical protein